jgi:malate synthase
VLDDGRKISEDLVRAMIPDELEKVKEVTGGGPTYDQAARIFVDMSTSADFAEFLTLPLYERV